MVASASELPSPSQASELLNDSRTGKVFYGLAKSPPFFPIYYDAVGKQVDVKYITGDVSVMQRKLHDICEIDLHIPLDLKKVSPEEIKAFFKLYNLEVDVHDEDYKTPMPWLGLENALQAIAGNSQPLEKGQRRTRESHIIIHTRKPGAAAGDPARNGTAWQLIESLENMHHFIHHHLPRCHDSNPRPIDWRNNGTEAEVKARLQERIASIKSNLMHMGIGVSNTEPIVIEKGTPLKGANLHPDHNDTYGCVFIPANAVAKETLRRIESRMQQLDKELSGTARG